MTDMQIKVLNLIKEEKTASEIISILNISTKRLINILQSLKNNGYNYLNKSFRIDGKVQFEPKMDPLIKDKIIEINEIPSKLDFLLISDTHLGAIRDRVDLLDKTYNYAVKNNINTIIHLGDIINGMNSKEKSKNKNIDTQLQYFIKKYPCHQNIITYLVKGNHDNCNDDIDIQSFIEANRLDIVVFPSTYQKIKIGKDSLVFSHGKCIPFFNDKIRIWGNSHKYKTVSRPESLDIIVPSISDIKIGNALESGILRMKLMITDNIITSAILTHSIFAPEIVACSEQEYVFTKQKK